MIELAGLTPMHHILLSVAGTKEQEIEEGESLHRGSAQ